MKKLDEVILLIKEIDECLDAYSFKGYTFEEYEKIINEGKTGDRGLRNLIKYNSGGSYVWVSWMQDCLDKCKKYTNKIWLEDKKKEIITIDDIYQIKLLIKRIRETKTAFKKNTDDYSLYPLHSEKIGNNLNNIALWFEKYINMKDERKNMYI